MAILLEASDLDLLTPEQIARIRVAEQAITDLERAPINAHTSIVQPLNKDASNAVQNLLTAPEMAAETTAIHERLTAIHKAAREAWLMALDPHTPGGHLHRKELDDFDLETPSE